MSDEIGNNKTKNSAVYNSSLSSIWFPLLIILRTILTKHMETPKKNRSVLVIHYFASLLLSLLQKSKRRPKPQPADSRASECDKDTKEKIYRFHGAVRCHNCRTSCLCHNELPLLSLSMTKVNNRHYHYRTTSLTYRTSPILVITERQNSSCHILKSEKHFFLHLALLF